MFTVVELPNDYLWVISHIGKEHSLEVLETKEVSLNTLDVSIDESQPEAPTMEPSVLEMHKPRMKVFHGTVAPGLRVRSAPSLIVSCS